MLNNLIDRIKLPFRKDKELYLSLYEILGIYPRNISYYKLALMHKSIGHRGDIEPKPSRPKGKRWKNDKHKPSLGKKLNNERLEFLGDAILDAVVGDIVYAHFPGKPEGFLTNTRSKLVQRETLGKLAQEIGVNRLILSSGRSASHNSYMGGNAFEALVGALYLDRGYDACMKFWTERILGKYINIDKMAYKEVNFKSKLIEWAQKNRIQLTFRLEDQSKDQSGSPTFKYTVVLETIDGCTASGFSKKEAQQHACEETLKKLKKKSDFLDAVFAAKTDRTKMEEMPVENVPDTDMPKENFIISNSESPETTYSDDNSAKAIAGEAAETEETPIMPAQPSEETSAQPFHDESVDNVEDTEKAASAEYPDDAKANSEEETREDIIAAAEAAAYKEE